MTSPGPASSCPPAPAAPAVGTSTMLSPPCSPPPIPVGCPPSELVASVSGPVSPARPPECPDESAPPAFCATCPPSPELAPPLPTVGETCASHAPISRLARLRLSHTQRRRDRLAFGAGRETRDEQTMRRELRPLTFLRTREKAGHSWQSCSGLPAGRRRAA